MEHKLILGGAQYLPFARSRISALRASGQEYATQRFLLPDAEVRVQIAGDQEYIYITGSACTQLLDSGIVETEGWGGADPARYTPGTLYEAGSVPAYNAEFVPTDPVSAWKVKDSEGGQISGEVSRNKTRITGRIPYDAQAARSFSPKTIQLTEDPVTWGLSPDDDLLATKKALTHACPASIFTGRTRLYVQAMYGQPLYQGNKVDKEGNITSAGAATPKAPTLGSATGNTTPSLMLPAALPKADESLNDPVALTTGSGVHLDARGNHWLFTVSSGSVAVYPLVSSSCTAAWRRYLDASSPAYASVDQVDRDHIEAYVLASSRPDVNKVQTITVTTVSLWSMGYSWHWNKTGLAADIVSNAQVSQGGGNSCMRSTHYRLTMEATVADGVTTWGAAITVIEGPADWAVERQLWCIAEPDWETGNLAKITPQTTDLFVCDAPFYAFYIDDELQVCRVSVEQRVTVSARYTSDAFFDSAPVGGPMLTAGLLAGWGETVSSSGNFYVAMFQCGAQSFSELSAFRAESGTRDDISAKAKVGQNSGTLGPPFATPFNIEYGYPPDYSLAPFPENYQKEESARLDVEYTWTASVVGDVFHSAVDFIAPFYDAEAMYARGYSDTVRTYSGQVVKSISSPAFGTENRARLAPNEPPPNPAGDWSAWLPKYVYAGGAGGSFATILSTTTPGDSTTTTVNLDEQTLVCRAGVLPATFTNLLQLHDNDVEEVEANFATLSSVRTDAPIVLGGSYVDPVGTALTPTAPVLVGWV